MKFSIVSFSKNGAELGGNIRDFLIECGHSAQSYSQERYARNLDSILDTDIREWTKTHFDDDCLIFIGACGIAVRAIALSVRSKATDPAVLVVDDCGRFVISLLSGHIGGANKISKLLSEHLDALPVITTASDISGVFSVDAWAAEQDISVASIGEIKHITSALLDGKTVGLISDFPVEGELPKGISADSGGQYGICISLDEHKKPYEHTLNLVPKILSVGVGCRKGWAYEKIETAISNTLAQNHLTIRAVKNLASIDLKKDEAALIEFADKNRIDFLTYSSEELSSVQGTFSSSAFVASVTGIDNVCERAAVRASGGGRTLSQKQVYDGVTAALAAADWRVRF